MKKRTHRRRRRFMTLRNPYPTAREMAERRSWVELWTTVERFVHQRVIAARAELREYERSRARRLKRRTPERAES